MQACFELLPIADTGKTISGGSRSARGLKMERGKRKLSAARLNSMRKRSETRRCGPMPGSHATIGTRAVTHCGSRGSSVP